MNNRFFVPVLALGIAALSAAASPSQAATTTLGIYNGPNPDSVPQWADFVTMSGSSSSYWRDAKVMEAQDGGTYQEVDYLSPDDTGPGTFVVYETIAPSPAGSLPAGHSYQIYFVNEGYSGNPAFWSVSTSVGTAVNNNGTITATSPG